MTALPEGYILGPPPSPSPAGLPEGYVLNTEAPSSWGLPAGYQPSTTSGDPITKENHGRIAAAAIERERQDRRAKGAPDLNIHEQGAILDTYRQIAGLPMLTNRNMFAETQKAIAEHQSGILNLARATSDAFERQGVNLVAPMVDYFSPGWGTNRRADIMAMNPFDPNRISGKAGGAIAAAPLLFAGGTIPSAAGIFGLQSMTSSLASSEDQGIEGIKKWTGAAGQGAITAGAILAGGQIAKWATGALAKEIPQLSALLAAGNKLGAGQIIIREAVLAGINLPPQMGAMLAGTIGDNLLASQTTDPNRQWYNGLEETAFNAAMMTLANHVVRAGDAIRASEPGAPELPGTRLVPINTLTSSMAPDGTVEIADNIPRTTKIDGKVVDLHRGLLTHEVGEAQAIQLGNGQEDAHLSGLADEHDYYRSLGVDPAKVEDFLRPLIAENSKDAITENPPMIPAHEELAASGREEIEKLPGEGPLALPSPPPEPESALVKWERENGQSAAAEPASIPPRPPNELPPSQGPEQPALPEPEGKAGSAIVQSSLAASTGDTRTAWDKLGDAVHSTLDGINRYSGRMFPTVTRLRRVVGEKLGTYISAKIWAPEKAAELGRIIIGGDKKLDLRVGTAVQEDQLRSLKAVAMHLPAVVGPEGKFTPEQINTAIQEMVGKREGPPGLAVTDEAELRALLNHPNIQEALQRANRISTFIGKEGSPYRTETEYQAALRDPRIQRAIHLAKMHYQPIIDALFRKAMNLPSDEPLAQRGLQTGLRTNLMVRDPSDPDRRGMILTGTKSGNLRNPQRGTTPFAREAKGTADAYEGRFTKIIENSLGRTADISFKNDAIKAMVDGGIAKIGPRGQYLTSIGKYGTRTLPYSPTQDLYIRSDAYQEVRGAFDVDSKEYPGMLKKAADLFNRTALVSISEAMYHFGNEVSTLVRSPGTGIVLPKLILKTIGLLTHDPTTLAQVSDLARLGAWRPNAPEMGHSKFYSYTLGLMTRVVGTIDHAGRLVMDDTFKKLAGTGVGLDTETNRRDFVNQIGQYNRRAQGRIVAFMRDTGLGPFATAGTNFYAQGIRSLMLSPGLKATSGFNAAKLRIMVAGRFAAILGGVTLVNYLRWGRVDGDDRVPIGAIRLKDGTDDKGRPTVRYLDVASLMNITRGLRAVGARALIEGSRAGKTQPEIASDASRDAITAALSPFEGPVVRAAIIAATGLDTAGYPVGPKIAKGESAPLAHVKAALLSANPMISRLTGQTTSPIAGKFEVMSKTQESVAQQIASREAGARVPQGTQTREEMDQSAREQEYRKAWTAGNQEPLISAVQRGEVDKTRAHQLAKEAGMSHLAVTTSHLPIETALRVYDAGTPQEKAELTTVMLRHLKDLKEKNPTKALPFLAEYQKRGLL